MEGVIDSRKQSDALVEAVLMVMKPSSHDMQVPVSGSSSALFVLTGHSVLVPSTFV